MIFRCFLLIVLVAIAFGAPANAQQKHLFSLGIQNFPRLSKLPGHVEIDNPIRDAKAVAQAVLGAGFTSYAKSASSTYLDLTREQFFRNWGNFLLQIKNGDVVFVYVSSHGWSIDGENFILPSDAPVLNTKLKRVYTRQLISLDAMLDGLAEREPSLVYFIVDACRSNPYIWPQHRKGGLSIGGSLLAAPQGRSRVLQLYSAEKGKVAWDRLDGDSREDQKHSLFAKFLIPALKQHHLTLGELIPRVKNLVYDASKVTSQRQWPQLTDIPGWRKLCLGTCRTHKPAPIAINPSKSVDSKTEARLIPELPTKSPLQSRDRKTKLRVPPNAEERQKSQTAKSKRIKKSRTAKTKRSSTNRGSSKALTARSRRPKRDKWGLIDAGPSP